VIAGINRARTTKVSRRTGHQEDVAVDPQGDEEDEGQQHQVKGEPAGPEQLGEGEGDEAEGRRVRVGISVQDDRDSRLVRDALGRDRRRELDRRQLL
jgi:hypothetical protein